MRMCSEDPYHASDGGEAGTPLISGFLFLSKNQTYLRLWTMIETEDSLKVEYVNSLRDARRCAGIGGGPPSPHSWSARAGTLMQLIRVIVNVFLIVKIEQRLDCL